MDTVKNRSALVCAALASAIAPQLRVSGVKSTPTPIVDDPLIDTAALVETTGRVVDVQIAAQQAVQRLQRRAANGTLIATALDHAGIDIAVDDPLAQGSTRDETDQPVYVVVSRHVEAMPLDFRDLTEEECRSLGSAIARIHRLDTGFLRSAGHPAFSGEQVRAQLSSWTRGLATNKMIPEAILTRWDELLRIDSLWMFSPVVCHGAFHSDDVLFSADSTVTAIHNWEHMSLADPASDFVWLFDDGIQQWQRDEVLSGYGEVLGSAMDSRIVPRARLWRQMTAVREFCAALKAEDHDRLASARKAVNTIAAALSPVIAVGTGQSVTAVPGSSTGRTVTEAENPNNLAGAGAGVGMAAGASAGSATGSSAGSTASSYAGSTTGTHNPTRDPDATVGLNPASDDNTVLSGANLSFSGTGDDHELSQQSSHRLSELQQGSNTDHTSQTNGSQTTNQQANSQSASSQSATNQSANNESADNQPVNSQSARLMTNTNMPALTDTGTRTTIAHPDDTRRETASEEAATLPFQTQAYIDTDAPDGTAHVTHSTSVRERLFPDENGEDLFASRKKEDHGSRNKMNKETPSSSDPSHSDANGTSDGGRE